MNILDDISLVYKVAKYYYIDNLSQAEIFKKTNISKPQISRILKKAREIGIIEIKVNMPLDMNLENMVKDIKKELNLKDVIVAPYSKDNNILYSISGDYLCNNILKYKNIGVGWNKCLYNIALNLLHTQEELEMTFYPLVGSIGVTNPYLQVNSIVDRFAEKFKSRAYYNIYPVLMEKNTISDHALVDLMQIERSWSNLDCAIIWVDGKFDLDNIYVKELPLIKEFNIDFENICCGILGSFFFKDGSEFQFPENYYVNSINIKTLKNIDNVIAVSTGIKMAEALVFAAKHKYYNTLITDEITIKSILSYLEKN